MSGAAARFQAPTLALALLGAAAALLWWRVELDPWPKVAEALRDALGSSSERALIVVTPAHFRHELYHFDGLAAIAASSVPKRLSRQWPAIWVVLGEEPSAELRRSLADFSAAQELEIGGLRAQRWVASAGQR